MTTIPWMYLDKEAASVNALKDYASMEYIINNYPDDLKESQDFLISAHAPILSRMPRKGAMNVRATESRVASSIDRIDLIQERYGKALAYMAWFRPAWAALTEDEQHILSGFFLTEGATRAEAVQRICEERCCEKSSVYRAKDKALSRLSLLLYGK